ncbi:MAG: HutD family protein [Planctomycetes bacterium]|nr:HutD family protein [Planctomycetota bacterium]
MTEVLHLRSRDARRVPWKNGRGFTDELALAPAGASFERGDFDLRISRATVDEPGPFSAFPGFDRVLVVVHGEALVLLHGTHAPRARLRRLEPHRFSGDWPTTAELPRGAIGDFNVLTRRGRCSADVQALALAQRRARETAEAAQVFVHVLSGALSVRISGEDAPFELLEAESLWIRGARPSDELDIAGASSDASLLIVRVRNEG